MSAIRVDTIAAKRQASAMQNYNEQVKGAINAVTQANISGWEDGKANEYLSSLISTAQSVSVGTRVLREYSNQLLDLIDMLES